MKGSGWWRRLLGFNPGECRDDWRTCGHCATVVAEGGMFSPDVSFGACGKCGVLRAIVCGNTCPNAPVEVK